MTLTLNFKEEVQGRLNGETPANTRGIPTNPRCSQAAPCIAASIISVGHFERLCIG